VLYFLLKEINMNIKTERVKHIFANTAKEMIYENGVESVSVRKISQKAGYTAGTVYNHFSGIDEILWHARSLVIEDLAGWMTDRNPEPPRDKDDLIRMFTDYVRYFIDRPNVYRFLYFHTLDLSEKTKKSLSDEPEFEKQIAGSFAVIAGTGRCSAEDLKIIGEMVLFSIQGILTLITTGNDSVDPERAPDFIRNAITFLTNKAK